MSAEKCPECGGWWSWPSEHRCPPIIATNTTNVHFTGIPAPRPAPRPQENPVYPGVTAREVLARWFRWLR